MKSTGLAEYCEAAPLEKLSRSAISPWCNSRFRRMLDVAGTACLLVPGLPLMAAAAVVVKLTSRGPVLFRQTRVGRGGTEFKLLKFRSMTHQRAATGPGLTRAGDARVTAAGRLLRRWKLDELPQLFNVLRGDMSLVGPRPDLAKYYAALSSEQRLILQVRPGITGAASLAYCDEETVLAQVAPDELESFYTRKLLPKKIQLDLDYAIGATVWTDITILFRTLLRIVR